MNESMLRYTKDTCDEAANPDGADQLQLGHC
jgi:hypothetical protein